MCAKIRVQKAHYKYHDDASGPLETNLVHVTPNTKKAPSRKAQRGNKYFSNLPGMYQQPRTKANCSRGETWQNLTPAHLYLQDRHCTRRETEG